MCRDKIDEVDYKDYGRLQRFTTDSGKIRARHGTGTCRRHQSQVALAIKRAREMALLPYTGGPRQLSSDERRHSSRSRGG